MGSVFRRWVARVVGLVLVLGASGAGANMAKWWSEGDGHGPLVPTEEAAVRVDSEDLEFEVAPSLDRANVTATYRMTSTGTARVELPVAFVVAPAEHAPIDDVPRATITLDGAPVAFTNVTEADVLGPPLERWLSAHPDAAAELARLSTRTGNTVDSEFAMLRKSAPGCRGSCDGLVRWYRGRSEAGAEKERPRAIVAAAEEAIPAAVTEARKGWSKLASRQRLAWLAFTLRFEPGATHTVVVRYEHRAGSDTSRGANTTFTYDYLLSPAKRWASFGGLEVTVRVPPETQLRASLPFVESQGTHHASFPALPDRELTFDVMSRRGLVFGMTQPTGYWALLAAVAALVTGLVGVGLGRLWARIRVGWQRVAACIFGTGVVAMFVSGAAMGLVSAAFPPYALGKGYSALFGLVAMTSASTVYGIVVSSVTARRSRRRAECDPPPRGHDERPI